MLKGSNLIWLGIIVTCAYGLYQVKYQVESLQEELLRTHNELAEHKESLHVLKAEWAYLSRPVRMERLTQQYLALEAVGARQIASLDDVPERFMPMPERKPEPPVIVPQPEAPEAQPPAEEFFSASFQLPWSPTP